MSSFVSAVPEDFGAAAEHLTEIGSSVTSANSAAASPTSQVAAAAQDQVSAAVSAMLSTYGQDYQALTAGVATFHEDFVRALSAGGNSYAATEAANTTALDL